MVLIPPDVGLQLRAQTDVHLQPVTPTRPIPADLPDLHAGQTFTARIHEAMPDNIYKALVAGKMITLQLPEGAKAGDQLELVVIDRTPRLLIAQQVPRASVEEGAQQPYPFASFSRAGQMIGQLLAPEGEPPSPTLLNRGEPLLPRPSASAQDILPALKTAVSQSGLFYESHQAQWVAGKLPLASLLQEPQGQLSHPSLLATHRIMQEAGVDEGAAMRTGYSTGQPGTGHAIPARQAAESASSTAETAGANRSGVSPAPTSSIPAPVVPDELRTLVQQQLDAGAGQRLMWQGEVWPGQNMDWQIEWEKQQGEGESGGETEPGERWRTKLALTTPRLGRIEATLQLESGGVRIVIESPEDGHGTGAAASDLRDAVPELAAALGEAGIPLLAMQIK